MRYLLAFFFLVMYAGDSIGLNVGLAPGISVKNVLLYLAFVGIALNAAVARNRELQAQSVFVPFLLLILYALVTWTTVVFILKYPDYSVRQSFISLKSSLADQLITLLVFFFGTRRQKDSLALFKTVIWIAVVGNIVTLIDTFNIPNLGLLDARVRDGRFEGFIGSANGYGQFLVLVLPLSVALSFASRGVVRKLAAFGAFCTLLALILTGSRGAYAGTIAGGLLGAFYLRRHLSAKVLLRVGFAAVAVIVAAIGASIVIGYSDVFLDRFARFGGSAHIATSGRSTIWMSAIQSMMENPLTFITGYGYQAYTNSREFYAATHNVYLTYLYDLGIIGLGLYVLVFAQILSTTRKALDHVERTVRPYLIAFIFGLFGFLVSIFFSEYHASAYLLWACMGTALRIAVDEKESRLATADSRAMAISRPYA